MHLPKSRRIVGLLLVLLITIPVTSVSAASSGGSCKKAGAVSKSKGGGKAIKIVCTKVGKKLVWVAKGSKSTGSCATSEVCVLGDIGPGGGVVFYDAGSHQSWGRYLEAAPSGWNGATSDPATDWGCRGTSISGSAGTAVGTGQANTSAIVSGCTTSGIAAQLAEALTFGGKSDWFLPSKDELDLMRKNLYLKNLGGFASVIYWSSSERVAVTVWIHSFYDDIRDSIDKNMSFRVRPVRAFG